MKRFFLLMLLSAGCLIVIAQVPQGFNYQAVAHNSSGAPIMNATIQVKLGILSDTLTPVIVWEELHSTVKTNTYGVFGVVIGTGTKQAGTATKFSDIDWKKTPLYIKVQVYYQGAWKYMGSAKLWSVPYSMIAGDLGGSVKKLSVEGGTTDMEEPLFEVKNVSGQTVFAVYNEGVRIYVDDGDAKGTKGGFAVGSFADTKADSRNFLFVSRDSIRAYVFDDPLAKPLKGGFAVSGFNDAKKQTNDYLLVGPDSVRVFIDKAPSTKTRKGGFAVGGFGDTKTNEEEYLRVTRDSARVYVNNNSTKGMKGGFAIGGFTGTEGLLDNFMSLTRENYFIGHKAGAKNTIGSKNSVIGYESASNNTGGYNNVFIGYRSGYSNTLGRENIFIGTQAGYSNIGYILTTPYLQEYGCYNIFIGQYAGFNNVSGFTNLFLGNISGYANISGYHNTFIGNLSGWENIDGYSNTYLGYSSGRLNISGRRNVNIGFNSGYKNISDANTFIGANSGENNISGGYNTMVGIGAGSNSTGSWNVFIGSGAGDNESGSNKLFIENSGSTIPLIGGDFAGDRVGINRMPTTYTLEVGGTIWANGSAIVAGSTTWSDARYKTNIIPLTDALSNVLEIQGIRYNWRQKEFPELNFPKGDQIGIIAQDLEKILPELVFTDYDGYKSVSYEKLTPILIEAIKEQHKQIESYKSQLQSLQEKVDKIEALITKAFDE